MPRPSDPADVAESTERSSTRMRRLAGFLALVATLLALLLGASALTRLGTAPPSAVEAWLIALGLGCIAAAIGWTLWRQAAIAAALTDARHEARAALALCDTWTWEADAANRLTRWSPPAGEAHRELAAGAVLGRTLWEVFGADVAAAACLRARLDSGLPLHALLVAHAVNGEGAALRLRLEAQPIADASGRIARWIGSARSIDEAAARDHDQCLLQALLPALPLPVFELAGDARAVTQVRCGNVAAAQWLGVGADELAGLPAASLLARLPQDLRPSVAQALAQPQAGAELPPCPGWQVRLHAVASAANSDAASSVRHWLLVLMPMARAEATAASAPAADAESFSYTVSHDLRAPVRVVEGFTKILKEDYGRQLDRIGNDHLDRVLGAAARMNSMIDALLALAQLSSRPVSRQPVNLSQLAAYVVEDLRRQAPERKVAVHVEAGLQAQGDPTLLRVVLENLIGNAWKYSARTRNAQIWLERGSDAGRDVFTVRDNGAGFDMRFADRLFGVFQRLHSASDFPGTGIGLATVRRIVARHGGEIWAESEVDRGSSFHFTIPSPTGSAG